MVIALFYYHVYRIEGGNINRSLETVNTLLSTPEQNQLFRPRLSNLGQIASTVINRIGNY